MRDRLRGAAPASISKRDRQLDRSRQAVRLALAANRRDSAYSADRSLRPPKRLGNSVTSDRGTRITTLNYNRADHRIEEKVEKS